MAVNLALVKQHLRIDPSDDTEDTYLQHLIEAATGFATSATGILNDEEAPAVYEHYCLLLIGHFHQNREAVSEVNMTKVPYGLRMLLMMMLPSPLSSGDPIG